MRRLAAEINTARKHPGDMRSYVSEQKLAILPRIAGMDPRRFDGDQQGKRRTGLGMDRRLPLRPDHAPGALRRGLDGHDDACEEREDRDHRAMS